MTTTLERQDPVRTMLVRIAGEQMLQAQVDRQPFGGGMEASQVELVTARYREGGLPRLLRVVMKRLQGRPAREAAIYEGLVAHCASRISPRLLAVEHSDDSVLLCLEAIRRTASWPWRNLSAGSELLVRLAHFHRIAGEADAEIPAWDYEAELGLLAEATWTALDRCRSQPGLSALARDLPALRRIVLERVRLREQLLAEHPFGCRPIHGDVHPGNVLVCRRGQGAEPVLLDWGRARLGSPLEDASSWLQSLRVWEPEAGRRHDTLLAAYLSAFGADGGLTSSVRDAYWIAGASNALSGALLHHLQRAQEPALCARRRAAAFTAARDWLRVLRRASASAGA
ncbi:phosphotransferase [Microvirga sp. GCM10011540]|uniref:phosphotransferase n=1 Tax=Microvirga sp. GCM10011540 TaxID=3317338 RepID=UPI00361B5217